MLNEQDIEKIVFDFYQLAIDDVLIGYQFQKIPDFPKHVIKIATFWKNQLYPNLYPPVDNIRFRAKHLPLHLHIGELGRWIILFHQVLDQWSKLNGEQGDILRWKEKVEMLRQMLVNHPMMFRHGNN